MIKVKNYIKRNIYVLQMLFSRYPIIYIYLYKLLGKNRRLLIDKNTEIVIEGFPRSGNTFSVVAFELAQSRNIKIAHHLHAAAQIIWAVQHNIPAVVLIRKPEDAVVSFVIREPHINIKTALNEYVKFYKAILPYKDNLFIAEFENVITDYEKVIVGINAKFGKSYELFIHSEKNVEKVFDLVQNYAIKESSKKILDESKVSRPSDDRKLFAVNLKATLNQHEYNVLMQQARRLYNNYSDTQDE